VARVVGQSVGGIPDHDLLAMATIEASGILGWAGAVGSLEKGKRADVVVVNGRGHDPYEHLFHSTESDVTLVLIDGVARAGSERLMKALVGGRPTERLTVGSTTRLLDLVQDGVEPEIANLTLAEATSRLRKALKTLPDLATQQEGIAFVPPPIRLELDHEEMAGYSIRPELPDATGQLTGQLPAPPAGLAGPLSDLLKPIDLDPLTVVDDDDYLTVLAVEMNLPKPLAREIGKLD